MLLALDLANNIGALVGIVVAVVVVAIGLVILGVKMPKIIAAVKNKKQAKEQADLAKQQKLAEGAQYEQAMFDRRADQQKELAKKEKEQKKQEAGSVLNIVQKQEHKTTKVEAHEKKASKQQIEQRDTVIGILQNKRPEDKND